MQSLGNRVLSEDARGKCDSPACRWTIPCDAVAPTPRSRAPNLTPSTLTKPADHARDIIAFFRRSSGPLSEADIAAGSGVGLPFVRSELYDVMREHECVLDVREDGTIVYDFGEQLHRIDERSWRDRLGSAGRLLWRGFKGLYRPSLAIALLVYALMYGWALLIPVALMLAKASHHQRVNLWYPFAVLGELTRLMFSVIEESVTRVVEFDRYGYAHDALRPATPDQRAGRPSDKGFATAVFDFVFGPPRARPRARHQEREVAAFVRNSDGVLTVSDIQKLSGYDRAEAERFFAFFVARFGGEARDGGHGQLYAVFDELRRGASSGHDEPITMYWDEYVPPYELNGNDSRSNKQVVGIGLFNFVCALATLAAIPSLGLDAGPGLWLLGYIPALLFGLLFAVPAIRSLFVDRMNEAQHEENIRRRLFRQLFAQSKENVRFVDLVNGANAARTTEERLSVTELRPLIRRVAQEIEAEVVVDGAHLVLDIGVLRVDEAIRDRVIASESWAEDSPAVFSTRDEVAQVEVQPASLKTG